MKKVWLISYHLDGVTAGPSVRFQRYAPLLMERGYRLVFYTKRTSAEQPETESREHFDVVRITSNYKYFHNTLFLAKCLWRAIFASEKPATVLTFSITTFHLWLLPLIKLRGLKVVFVNTMSLHNTYLKGNSAPVKFYNWIHNVLYSVLFRNINGIVNSSQALSQGFADHGVAPSKLKVIYNGVNSKRFKPVDAATKLQFRQKLDLPENAQIILFVGLKVERKGIIDLMDTWRLYAPQHPNQYLVMVGEEKNSASDQDYNSQWEGIKTEISNPALRVINRPNHPQIEEYFFASDIFIFLSKKEGMPNVVLEAMATGLPMLVTEFEGFSEDYGRDGEEYLMVNRDAKHIAETLDKITSDKALYDKIRKNSLQKVENDFLVEKSIDRYIDLINN
jgi:glycosyltransferase involved in cell wall biosynthesis